MSFSRPPYHSLEGFDDIVVHDQRLSMDQFRARSARTRVGGWRTGSNVDIAINSASGKPLLIGVVADLVRDAGHAQKPGIPCPLQELGGAARKDAAKSDQK